MTLIIEVLTGPPGNGKTHTMRTEAVKTAGLYVFAYPQIALLEEQAEEFGKDGLRTFSIHSARAGDVQGQLFKALSVIHRDGLGHCAILMTHACLLRADLSGLGGMHWRIDEAIDLHGSGMLHVKASDVSSWASRFALRRSSQGWSLAVGRSSDLSVQDRNVGPFGCYAAFADAADRGVAFLSSEKWRSGNWGWLSFFSPTSLPEPLSVQIAAAGFERSISRRLMEHLLGFDIDLRFRRISRPRSSQPVVRLHYFAKWEESSPHWDSRDGRSDLKLISDWISETSPDLGFWAANDEAMKVLDWRISNTASATPKLPGRNHLDQLSSCAIFYSAKATADDAVLVSRFELTGEQIRVSREDEDIFQFIYRGAIRRPDYGGSYDIYLFSQQQAERQVERLIESGLTNVEARHVSIEGFPSQRREPPKKGRKKLHVNETPEARRTRKSADRKRQREKAKLSGE